MVVASVIEKMQPLSATALEPPESIAEAQSRDEDLQVVDTGGRAPELVKILFERAA